MDLIFDKENIVNGNKLIAEFLGYRYNPFNNEDGNKAGWWHKDTPPAIIKLGSPPRKILRKHYLCRNHNELRYFNSYDWIMDVVEKLESMGYTTSLKTNYVRLNPIHGSYYNTITQVSFNGYGHSVFRCVETDIESTNDEYQYLYSGKEKLSKRQAIWLMVVESIKYINENNS